MSASTDTSATDMQAELQYLRQRNKELQSQLDEATKRRDLEGETKSRDENNREETASSRSPLDSGLELTEINQAKGSSELVRSNSTPSDEKLPSGLLHRRTSLGRTVSGKENNIDDGKHIRSFSSSRAFTRRPKFVDVDIMHTTNNKGHLDPLATVLFAEGGSFDNECDNNHFSRSEGVRTASDGGGNYSYPTAIVQNDHGEGRLTDTQIQIITDSDDSEESDGLMDDDSSHHKHLPKNLLKSPCSMTPPSAPSFPPFKDQVKERAGWLIGLLFFQSCSSFIIQHNQDFLQSHMVIVQFLTMLVGAGGNAGNQASVRVIRSLALGTLNRRTMRSFLIQEAKMALCLSALVGTTGFVRAAMFRTPPGETVAVTASVCVIVAISVAIGCTLPLGMKRVGIDPANSSTSIQVIMDILGVLITVCVSSFVLSFKIFQADIDSGGAERP